MLGLLHSLVGPKDHTSTYLYNYLRLKLLAGQSFPLCKRSLTVGVGTLYLAQIA